MRILITGGCGFIGHHFVEHIVKNKPEWDVHVLDMLTYAGRIERLEQTGVKDAVELWAHDFRNPLSHNLVKAMGPFDHVWHLGAETHVDNSIENPGLFVESNVLGTVNVMEAFPEATFWMFSTDEVFGPAPGEVSFGIGSNHAPTNPYAASKSGAEMMVRAIGHSKGQDYVITRTMNCFGERQHPEKFIPLVTRSVLGGKTVKIHANADLTEAGKRTYIHARNVASAYVHLMEGRTIPQQDTFHIVGEQEVDNLALAQMIAEIVGKELRYELVDFHSARPGHDLRYSLELDALAWEPPKTFVESLEKTVKWTLEHPEWLRA